MNFRAPIPFTEALAAREVRSILPTDFRTTLLRQIAPEIRRRSIFTAGGTNARHLQMIDEGVRLILEGKSNRAEQRSRIRAWLADLGYRAPEAEQGTLTNLASDQRLALQLDTNVQMMQSVGRSMQGDIPAVRDQYPAWEFVRFFGPADSEKQRDWPTRWARAGGQFFGRRMIALKDDEVWDNLGSSALFPDGLDNRYAPYAFSSGMDRIAIDRDECIALGLITRDEQVEPENLDMNGTLQAGGLDAAPDLQASIIESLAAKGITAEIIGGVLKYIGGYSS